MQVQANITGTTLQQQPKPAETVDSSRKELEKVAPDLEKSSSSESKSVQPEEILTQIKSLTENGLFSVRFEKSQDSDQMVIRVVNTVSGETIRQIPAESILGIKDSLDDFTGNVINTHE